MKQYSLSYPAKITQDEEGYSIEFLDFAALSEADSLEKAIFNAQEALDVTLLGLMDTRQPVPEPSRTQAKDIFYIPASPEVIVPVLLYKGRKEEHKTMADIAKAMDISFQRYHDIERGRNITLKTLKRAAAALGAVVEIKFTFLTGLPTLRKRLG